MTEMWSDQALLSKLAFDGYHIEYIDNGAGIPQTIGLTNLDLVDWFWKELIAEFREFGPVDKVAKIEFPTPRQLAFLFAITASNFDVQRVLDNQGVILWEAAK